MPAKSKVAPVEDVTAHPWFTPGALNFLRKLKRNNRREWFEARREVYERELRQPMLALAERITRGMESYAPDHIRPARKCVFRIYRDIRFSPDKSPYKTHVAAWWTRNGLDRTSGGGYYLQINPKELIIAAGVYMPPREQTYAIRQYLLEHYAEFQRLIENKKLRAKMDVDDPRALTRPPKGFPAEHPAMEWIKWREWGVAASLSAEEALKPKLAVLVERYFRLAAPLVDFLNTPLLREAQKAEEMRKPMFALY